MTNLPTEEEQQKSKSQLKREMLALQKLGGELIKLSPPVLAKMPLPDELRKAVIQAQAITSNSATRRQLQYIGRLMRECDATPIAQALASLQNQHHQTTEAHHHLEQWRDRLIREGDPALTAFLTEFPNADSQQMRQLIRKAQQEQKLNKPPTAARNLFRYLRELQE